jgi:hypothetical protein
MFWFGAGRRMKGELLESNSIVKCGADSGVIDLLYRSMVLRIEDVMR